MWFKCSLYVVQYKINRFERTQHINYFPNPHKQIASYH
jgi:hypothetical protein